VIVTGVLGDFLPAVSRYVDRAGRRGDEKRKFEDEISLRLIRFFLDSSARENYTFVSCFIYVNAASMVNIDRERRQTQPRQSIKVKATHSGNAIIAFPEVFKRQCSSWFRACRQNSMLFA
jgi:hypothetical protein